MKITLRGSMCKSPAAATTALVCMNGCCYTKKKKILHQPQLVIDNIIDNPCIRWHTRLMADQQPRRLILRSVNNLKRPLFSVVVEATVRSKNSDQISTEENTINRNLGHFSPCIWGDHFASYSFDKSVFEAYTNEIEELKEHVKGMFLKMDACGTIEKINLINTLHRLGISYHFEEEIDGVLEHLFLDLKLDDDDARDYDLYTISMIFRVFRQHGYKMPCDVFHKFMDSNRCKFKETLTNDVRGMLSLYEASQLRLHEEDVLEEALLFTTTHLDQCCKESAHRISPHLAKQVTRAMEQSFHKGIPRVEARVYISTYEEDESHNEVILKLAKLDFSLVQLMYQQELSLLSRWWKDVGLSTKFPYARNRVVESFLLTVALCFEPRDSLARIFLSKIIIIGPWIDDTYDAYGTFEELQLFTDAINRWDINAANQLPDYMKFVFTSLVNLYDDFDKEMAKSGRSYAIHHSKEAVQDLCRAYFREAEWLKKNYIPSFDEYIEIAYRSNTFYLLVTTAYIGMIDTVTPETYEWLQMRPRIFQAAASIGRLQNDIVDIDQYNEKRNQKASAVKCYKKQYGVSDKEAVVEIGRMIGDSWKDINHEILRIRMKSSLSSSSSEHRRKEEHSMIAPFVNFARIMDVIYKYEDGYSKPEVVKDMVTSLFVQSLSI